MIIFALGGVALTALLVSAAVFPAKAFIAACRPLARWFSLPVPVRVVAVEADTEPMGVVRGDETRPFPQMVAYERAER